MPTYMDVSQRQCYHRGVMYNAYIQGCLTETNLSSGGHVISYQCVNSWVAASESPKHLGSRYPASKRQVRVTKPA